jgi:hypothetical protein
MSEKPISPLRQGMIEDMMVRNFVEETRNDYIWQVKTLTGMQTVAQRAKAGDVVDVQVRVHHLDELEIQPAHQLKVAIDLLDHRVDDQPSPPHRLTCS